MCTEYKYYKKEINKKEIDELEIYFDNGDFFKIKKYEIKDYNISLSDKLLWIENTIHRAVAKGVVKLKIAETKVTKYQDAQVFNMKEFIKDRKGVMERRCLDGGIAFIALINKYNNCFRLYGDIIAKVQDGYLIIEFLESEKYPNNNPYSSIMLDNFRKKDIYVLDLVFENCEELSLYQNEIIDINIKFKENLVGVFSELQRVIEAGYIKIKLDEDHVKRTNGWFEDTNNKYFEKRICGKGTALHDICHLNIKFDYWTSLSREEYIEIDDIRYIPSSDVVGKPRGYFYGGYAKIDKDGVMTITFGKNSRATLDRV